MMMMMMMMIDDGDDNDNDYENDIADNQEQIHKQRTVWYVTGDIDETI